MATSFTSEVSTVSRRDACVDFTREELTYSCRDGVYWIDENGDVMVDEIGAGILFDQWPVFTSEVSTVSCRD